MDCSKEYQCSLYILCPLRKILEREIEAEYKERFKKYVDAFDAAPKDLSTLQVNITLIDDISTPPIVEESLTALDRAKRFISMREENKRLKSRVNELEKLLNRVMKL